MPETLRSCAKTACRWPAAASLSYRYATREVWLLDLAVTPDPSLYDLCPHHADALVVPKGWTRVDDRTDRPAVIEPAAAERVAAASSSPPRHAAGRVLVGAATSADRGRAAGRSAAARSHTARPNRYESLARDLPRLAAALAADTTDPVEERDAPVATVEAPADVLTPDLDMDLDRDGDGDATRYDVSDSGGSRAATGAVDSAPLGAVPLHGAELLPETSVTEVPGAGRGEPVVPAPPRDDELTGQLVMPGLSDGAVVIELAQSRRRRASLHGPAQKSGGGRKPDGPDGSSRVD